MDIDNFSQAIEAIASLIEGQRIAKSGTYQIVWDKDHFEIRKTYTVDKDSFLIIRLPASDINKGLTSGKWDLITARLHTLIETEVIK